MKKITLFSFLLLSNIIFSQTTYNLDWEIGMNGANASLTIDVGDTVIWTWTDSSPHSVRTLPESQETFDSGISSGVGTTFSFTFTEAGINDYQCGVHTTSMFGTITVVSATPTCDDPSNLMSMNLTDDSVDISWTENGTATEWEIEYDPAGFTQGNGTLLVDNDGVIL
ncbi:cupredoxin domain-containing protein [Mesonia aquimarina]|uniref:cupredoxin domain-containing protein n=1 Tax=Mesonia aquimarina TaxID=1504967 RepID=UPI000EF57B67|nr:plastocyanin/azurin family copper-binding protein [Mesonia aquimarina]